jgi:RNA polymerase sigma factor (sigma-70 family)
MKKYRSALLDNLAAQLLRGPIRLRMRQLRGVEFLLSVLENGKSYPFDFVRHALTGYRAPANGEAGDTLINAAALREDLLRLAEELSASADLAVEALPQRLYSVSDLALRFDVSTKTIFRWHRRGLVGWRVRIGVRRQRLAFPEHSVRQFVASNADLVSRGSSFSQLSATEREQIIARARELADRGQQTVNAVAKVIGRQTNRAVETIRLILKSYDEGRPRAGIFNRSPLHVDADDARMRVWEAHVDGERVEALAERFGKPVRWVYKTLTEMRARELQSREIEFVPSDEFEHAGAEQEILNDPHAKNPAGAALPAKRIPRDLPPYLQQLFRVPLLTPAGERALFRRMNFLKHQADQARRRIDPERATAAQLDPIEALLDEAGRVKNRITQANLRLVVSIAKRHMAPTQDFFELVSDGNVSLMRAVDKFDYSRGFKFSTYASWALMKNFARSVPEGRRRMERYQTGRDELLDLLPSQDLDELENDTAPATRRTLDRMLGALDEREREILRRRYGLDEHGEPQTLEQIGQRFGVSKERIRQLEARAMGKLREDFSLEAGMLSA